MELAARGSGSSRSLATGFWPAFALACALLGASLAALEVPYLASRVNDYADMIDLEAEGRIEGKLADFETRTGSQVAVLTLDSLEGEALEEFSFRVAETWGLGREEADDGVLLFIAKNDRKMRIEVGYGLEHQLTDAQSGRILRNVLRPNFQAGDFSGGIEAGVDAILGTLEGADVIPPDSSSSSSSSNQFVDMPILTRAFIFLFFLSIVGLFSATALFTPGCQSYFLFFFLMPFWLAFPTAIIHPSAGIICLVLWIVVFIVTKLFLRSSPGKKWVKAHPRASTWMRGGGGGGFSGGGFSSGGFSGGGGSFGGGGASGSW